MIIGRLSVLMISWTDLLHDSAGVRLARKGIFTFIY